MARQRVQFLPNFLPIFHVRLRSERILALFDTGARMSLITGVRVAPFDLPVTAHRTIVDVFGGQTVVPVVTLTGVGFGSMILSPFEVGIAPVTHFYLGTELILGINAFRDQRLQIDLAAGHLHLLS
jgi:hypothetical protein